jgi:short-subunit dehydrogenase
MSAARGQRVLLTGASGGIGGAVARELAQRGYRLVLSGRNERALVELATPLRLSGATVDVVEGDLLEAGGAARIVERSLAADPALDLVINAAGASHFGGSRTRPTRCSSACGAPTCWRPCA